MLVSDAAARVAADEMPADSTLRDLGQHRLRDLTQAERLFQLERIGAPSTFPPLRSVDMQLAGTQAIFSSNPIDQLVRDAMTIAQHVAAGPMMTEAAGALLLGLPPTGPLAAII